MDFAGMKIIEKTQTYGCPRHDIVMYADLYSDFTPIYYITVDDSVMLETKDRERADIRFRNIIIALDRL